MRVLWFTGVQLPAVTGEKLNRAGWIEGLRRALEANEPEIELGIASFGTDDYSPFREGNATYFNIDREPRPQSKWGRLFRNWRHYTVDQQELERCLEIVDRYQPDLVYIFGTENPFGLLCDKYPVPAIISIQSIVSKSKTRVFAGLPLVDIFHDTFHKKFLLGRGVIHKWWRMNQQSRMERLIFGKCQYYDGRTAWDKRWLTTFNPAAEYYPINRVLGPLYYQAVWNPKEADRNLVYTTSSNAAFKGGVTLVRAFAELRKRGRDEIKLRMAGVNKGSRVGKAIHRLIHKYNMSDQVTLLGRLFPEQIISEMKSASLFVLPSHIDNSPNSLGEAMIIGMPCVASNAGGIPSMLEDGVEGLIYPHDEIGTLADRIELALDRPRRAKEFGSNARKRALSRHDPLRISERVVSMYEDVLSRS